MTRRETDASRERRLWIKQVIMPVATLIVAGASVPEFRQAILAKFDRLKKTVQTKFKRKEEGP